MLTMKWWAMVIMTSSVVAATAAAQPVYFLAGEIMPVHGDSFVVPIEDGNDIIHARDLIRYGTGIGQAIFVADMACGEDGINRDYLDSDKPQWGWHVTQFGGFTDMIIELLDGSPGLVENDCVGWVSNTGGQIGFWNYTIVEELGRFPAHWQCDFYNDDTIDMTDFIIFAQQWLDDCGTGDCGGVDLDDSGQVNGGDFAMFADCWDSPFASEPSVPYECWECPTQCHGDADCDGTVSAIDWVGFRSCLGTSEGDWNYDPCHDFNRDGTVNETDVSIMEPWMGYSVPTLPSDCSY